MKRNTDALCPVCLETLPAAKSRKGHEVYLERTCPTHGRFETRIAKDAHRFFDKTYDVEGKAFTPVCEFKGRCGPDCGWCDAHLQHICSGLVEITDDCNMTCPVCYFGEKAENHITVAEFERRLDTLLTVETGQLDVLQISGGECLLHPDFCDILDAALRRNIGRIVINTNGLALIKNHKVFNAIRDHRDRVEVYLQFDGFDDDVYKALRGNALLKTKQKIISKLNEHEIKICLAVTVYRDNLKDIPAILELATKTEHISGITFQRLTKVGKASGTELPTVLQEDILLASAGSGMMGYKDLIPLPCSHENCTSLGFLFCQGDEVYSLGDYIDYTRCKDALSNRVAFDKTVLDYMQNNICKCFVGKVLGGSDLLEKLQAFASGNGSCHKDMKILRIIVKNFMDAECFDFERAKKCCTGISVGNGKVVPFCLHNTLKGKMQW